MARCQGWDEERFGLLALNAKGELLAERILSMGTATGTLVSPREFFREALRYGATSALAAPQPPQRGSRAEPRGRAAHAAPAPPRGSLGVPWRTTVLGCGRCHSFRAAEGWDRG